MDAERLNLLRALNCRAFSLEKIMLSIYYSSLTTDQNNVFDWLKESPVHATHTIGTPSCITNRYLTEGITCGLSPLAAIGKAIHIATPVIDATVALTKSILGTRIQHQDVTLDDLETGWLKLQIPLARAA